MWKTVGIKKHPKQDLTNADNLIELNEPPTIDYTDGPDQ